MARNGIEKEEHHKYNKNAKEIHCRIDGGAQHSQSQTNLHARSACSRLLSSLELTPSAARTFSLYIRQYRTKNESLFHVLLHTGHLGLPGPGNGVPLHMISPGFKSEPALFPLEPDKK